MLRSIEKFPLWPMLRAEVADRCDDLENFSPFIYLMPVTMQS